MLTSEQRAQITNVIFLMMENRSFDHMLGYLSLPNSGYSRWEQVEGVRQALASGYANLNPAGAPVAPYPLDPFWNSAYDPPHERDWVAKQLGTPSVPGRFPMNGFVEAYYAANGHAVEPGVSGYYGASEVAAFDFFARNFLVCDRWFASLPASTQPNRLMSLSGYTLRDYTGNAPDVTNQHLVYDWLEKRSVEWSVYSEGWPFVSVIPDRWWSVLTGSSFRGLAALNPATLPPVAFIEPRYTSEGVGTPDDDHWPTNIYRGQIFLHDVYTKLFGQGEASRKLWSGCVMIVTYDEHGGFFDHVTPLGIETPLPHGAQYTKPFATTGVRVPAFVISPFVKPGSVSSVNLDHTSLLKFLGRLFGADAQYEPWVDDREGVGSVDDVLDNFSNPAASPPTLDEGTLEHVRWMGARPAPAPAVDKSNHALAIEAAEREMWQKFPQELRQKNPELARRFERLPKPKPKASS